MLDKEEINEFCFTNGRDLTPSGLHDNNILCTVEYTFFIAIHVQSFNTFYVLFAEIFLILWILFSLCEQMTSYASHLHISKNLNISGTRWRIEKPRMPFWFISKIFSDKIKIGRSSNFSAIYTRGKNNCSGSDALGTLSKRKRWRFENKRWFSSPREITNYWRPTLFLLNLVLFDFPIEFLNKDDE